MEPLDHSLKLGKTACTYQSTQCVIWEGPNLPCINLCKGDSIQDVVYKLAEKVCLMAEAIKIDASTINFSCIKEGDNTTPDNLKETIQALIYKACESTSTGGGSTGDLPNIELPSCLWHPNIDGDFITIAPLNEAVSILAGDFCQLVTTVTGLQSQINVLDGRVDALELAGSGSGGSGGGTTTPITISPSCVSGTPGVATPIGTAFEALETSYCNFKSLLGSPTQINTAVASQCFGLGGLDQLFNDTDQMNELTNWSSSPGTMAQSLTNAWLTICDMRAKLVNYLASHSGTCILIPSKTLSITSITANTAIIAWTHHTLAAFDQPLSVIVTVYNYDPVTGSSTGSAIAGLGGIYPGPTPSSPGTLSASLNTIALDYTKNYVVKIASVYDCGTSETVQVVGKLNACPVNFKLKVVSSNPVNTITMSGPCASFGSPATTITRTVAVTLTDTAGATVTNTKPIAITATLKLTVTDCNIANDVFEYITITIPPGANTWTGTYGSSVPHVCASTGSCSPILRGNSLARIALENISYCDVINGPITYL